MWSRPHLTVEVLPFISLPMALEEATLHAFWQRLDISMNSVNCSRSLSGGMAMKLHKLALNCIPRTEKLLVSGGGQLCNHGSISIGDRILKRKWTVTLYCWTPCLENLSMMPDSSGRCTMILSDVTFFSWQATQKTPFLCLPASWCVRGQNEQKRRLLNGGLSEVTGASVNGLIVALP